MSKARRAEPAVYHTLQSARCSSVGYNHTLYPMEATAVTVNSWLVQLQGSAELVRTEGAARSLARLQKSAADDVARLSALEPPSGAVLALVVVAVAYAASQLLCGRRREKGAAVPELEQPVVLFQRSPSSEPERLSAFDGRPGADGAAVPLYMALRGTVLDVSKGASFYGPGGPYEVLGGKDASRALAVMDMKGKAAWARDCAIRRIDDLSAEELKILDDWAKKLSAKYPTVGKIVEPATAESKS